ncbi:MAG: hypothetical protein SOR65_01975 [Odoribacter sp.]|nr:hypothetical protein [Odoribacter sp.]
MIKKTTSPIAKSVISQLEEYNFTLPIKHLDWTHNLVLIKQGFYVKLIFNSNTYLLDTLP